jgi:cell division protein FtsB
MERLKYLRRNWPMFALLVFYIYLAVHALSGSQGLMSWVDYENDISFYESELKNVRQERALLEQRTDALKSTRIDLDVLDIKAREHVFLTKPGEVTIWLDQTP